MARYTGATCRISRRYGQDLEFKIRDIESKCKLTTPPGQHGQRKRRETEYGTQLAAKQMLRLKYGVLERYFHVLYKKAARHSGVTGVMLLQMLEQQSNGMFANCNPICKSGSLSEHKNIILVTQLQYSLKNE